jgi:hypothetical protein
VRRIDDLSLPVDAALLAMPTEAYESAGRDRI